MSLRSISSSNFYTHRTRTSTMFVKKIVSVACHLSVKQLLVASFWNFFVYQFVHPKKNLIIMWKKNWKTEYFFLQKYIILNEAECLVCEQILRKKCDYSLKLHYWTCHSKLYSIMGCERECLLKKLKQHFIYFNIPKGYMNSPWSNR